jgi:ACS family glucarate transporter-like MFS transporter
MAVRHRLIVVTFTLSMLLYIDRIAISTAKDPIVGAFQLTDTQFGWVMSAFALGYALFQAPAGLLADRLGPRVVLAGLVGVWSIFTGLTALAWGLGSLLAIRFLFGAAEAGAFPSCARAFYMWLPTGERGFAQGMNFSGSRLGSAFALPAVAALIAFAGWREAFLILAVVGIAWAAGWFLWFRDRPEDHKGVSATEREHIVAHRGARALDKARPEELREVFRQPNIWLAMVQYFASNFTFFFCLTWLYPHLQRTYGLDPVETGLFAALPLIGGACGSWVSGALVDLLYRRGHGQASRRIPAIVGFLLAAGGLGASLAFHTPVPAVLCLTVAVFGADMTLPPSWAYCIDIGKSNAGAVSGSMNMAGNIGSFVTSLAFPYLLAMTGSTTPFFITAILLNLAAVAAWLRMEGARPTGASATLRASASTP